MIEWLTRWWREGDGTREQVLAEERRLRKAIEEHTEQSRRATVIAEIETERTRRLIGAVEQTIQAIKREE